LYRKYQVVNNAMPAPIRSSAIFIAVVPKIEKQPTVGGLVGGANIKNSSPSIIAS
jgi:hypothetical protein